MNKKVIRNSILIITIVLLVIFAIILLKENEITIINQTGNYINLTQNKYKIRNKKELASFNSLFDENIESGFDEDLLLTHTFLYIEK